MLVIWLYDGTQKCLASGVSGVSAVFSQLIILRPEDIYEYVRGVLWFSCQQMLVATQNQVKP